MTEYTPTTEQVIDQYARREPPRYGTVSSRTAEFNRWLEQVKAEAWEEGKRAGLRQSDWEHGDTATQYIAVNPYRQEEK